MPIRFRCVYCNQLLGISRRKAGTIVRCTTCEGQLIVPDPSDAATEAAHQDEPPHEGEPKTAGAGDPGGVFENLEFDAFLRPLNGGGPAVASPPAPPPAKRSSGAVPAPAPPIISAVPPAADVALTLSRRGLTVAVVLAVLVVGLSFAAGLWAGLALH